MRGPSKSGAADAQSTFAGLTARLRRATRLLHARAEKSGIVAEILNGSADRSGYVLFIRNLLPAYEALESGLRVHAASPLFRSVDWPRLYRAAAIELDLVSLAGPNWKESITLLPAGVRYGRRVAWVARGNGERLIAHAYTRYLGDLSGGQIMKQRLATTLGLGSPAMTFYDFPEIDDRERFKEGFRAALDAAPANAAALVEEAKRAFELNIAVSNDVLTATRVHAADDHSRTEHLSRRPAVVTRPYPSRGSNAR